MTYGEWGDQAVGDVDPFLFTDIEGSTRAWKANEAATGETLEARDEYCFGPALNRAARIMAAAHGGQILCAPSIQALLQASPFFVGGKIGHREKAARD